MSALINAELTDEQRAIFIEVIEESLRVNHKPDLFNLLQHGIQDLIGHDVLIYGVSPYRSEQYEFGYFSTTLDFTDNNFEKMILDRSSTIHTIVKRWQTNHKVLFGSSEIIENEFPKYAVCNTSKFDELSSNLKQFVIHGFGDERANMKSIFIFAHIKSPVNYVTAYLFELLMPTLHCALLKVHNNRYALQALSNPELVMKSITKREIEILEWLHTGKTNWEISEILGIRPTTVKSHVQNIIRKLGVENRNQAAKRGLSMGLIDHQ